MRSHLGALVFVIAFIWSFSNSVNNCVQGNCLDDQRALLIQFNQSVSFDPSFYFGNSPKLSSWNRNTDCCSSWDGVDCDKAGHVIGLDLSNESIYGEINKSSSLFKLRYLVKLNLASDFFPFPSGFDQLKNLKYLNLSNIGFGKQILIEVARMTRLVTLDLSGVNRYVHLQLIGSDLETLIRNLTELRELVLDGVILTGQEKTWGRTLSTSLPKLQILSLSYCSVSGPLDSSLLKLRSLSVLHLDFNDISTQVPKFLGKFHNLTSLHLSKCGLYGKFPERILQLPKLQSLDLSGNDRLQGFLPEFSKNGLLHELVLGDTNFSGELPNSIGNLRFLSRLGLRNCGFNGSIPTSFSKLNQLEYLDLSNNSFTGSIMPINSFEKLIYIDLSHNQLTGPIPSKWNKPLKLVHLSLKNNLLNGTIPMRLLCLPSLQSLDMSMNQFTGQLVEFSNGSSSQLEYLDLSNNQLQGLIPVSIFEKPDSLIFSSNNFSGVTNSKFSNKSQHPLDPILLR